MHKFSRITSFAPAPQRLLVKMLTRDVTRCPNDTHTFQTSDRIKALESMFLRFSRAHLVWQRKCFTRVRHDDQPLLRDLEVQFTRTATTQMTAMQQGVCRRDGELVNLSTDEKQRRLLKHDAQGEQR